MPFRQFFYWDRSLSPADYSPSEGAFLKSQVPPALQGLLEERLQNPVPIDWDLPGLSSVDYQQLPYFQGQYRVLPPALLQQTQALRYPALAPYLDPAAPEQLGLLHLGPMLIESSQKRCWAVLRCNEQLQVQRLDYRLKPSFKLVSVKKACYTEQQQ